MIGAAFKFLDALSDSVSLRYDLTLRFKKKYAHGNIPDVFEKLSQLRIALIADEPTLPQLLDLVRVPPLSFSQLIFLCGWWLTLRPCI